jgi:hypothetical protein
VSGYLKNVTVKTVFDGDSVTAVLKPISFLDRVRIEDKLPSRDDSKEIQEQKRKSASEWLTKEIPQILGGYLVSVDGLKDAEGAPIAKEAVLLDGYFTGLVGVIYQEWFAQRAPKDPTVPAGITADASAIALSPSESLKSASAG